ncbi:ADP-ribosylation factor 1-like protein, partial [Trifolium pratense]
PYWRCYFPNTQAIIYVVDSSDTDRLVIAREEFHAILEEEELKGAVVLIFANKQDLPGALDDAAVTESLELHKIKNRQWAIFKTSAIKGEGLFEGLDWGEEGRGGEQNPSNDHFLLPPKLGGFGGEGRGGKLF